MRRRLIFWSALALVVAACSADTAEPTTVPTASPDGVSTARAERPAILPVLASSELSAGPNRFLFSLTDSDGDLVASPDLDVQLEFYEADRGPDDASFETGSRFVWTIEGERGLYVADAEFPSGGRWGTRFQATSPDGVTESVRVEYDVLDQSRTPAIGAPAPAVETPTADSVAGDLSRLSTDPSPEPRFYETSVADALDAGDPFVFVFATPAFCRTATCGPMLEMVKAQAADHPDLTFINVEPYVMEFLDGSLRPVLSAEGTLQAAPWTDAWRLLTEPYVVVVDGGGLVRAKFEGAFAPDELAAAVEGL